MKLIQNVAIQLQQEVVKDLIDLDVAMKPEGKFVEFVVDDCKKNPPGFEYPYDIQFKNTGMNQFRYDSLECDELTVEMRFKSLRRMLICLEKHVDRQIELELVSKRIVLQKKYDEMYDISELRKKAYDLREKLTIANLGTGELERIWNEINSK